MWANAQRDSRPAEYRWRPLFNAAKMDFNPLKFAGVPQTRQRISAISWPKFTIMMTCGGDIAVQQVFFRLLIHALVAKILPDRVVQWCRNGDFLRSVFSASCVQHISDMHSKFALRPHHVWKHGRHPISNR